MFLVSKASSRPTAHLGSLQVYILFVWQKTNRRAEWKMDINMKLQYAEITYTSIHLIMEKDIHWNHFLLIPNYERWGQKWGSRKRVVLWSIRMNKNCFCSFLYQTVRDLTYWKYKHLLHCIVSADINGPVHQHSTMWKIPTLR